MEKEKKYDWKELGNLLKSRYRHYHDNAPSPFDKLSFNEVLDFGKVSDNVYENPIIRALVLNEGKSLLNEAEYATYPINTTINYVSRAVNIPKYMFAKGGDMYNGNWFIKIKSFNEDGIKQNVEKAMHLCGYYLAREDVCDDDRYTILRYEPKYIDEANYYVRSCNYLYHISPLPYKEKIMRNGFVPKSKNGLFNYPDRCYFFLDDLSKDYVIREWIPTFKKANNKYSNENWCVYTIDISKIPSNVVFYLDPNLKGGVYTMDNITPKAIEDCETICSNKKNKI